MSGSIDATPIGGKKNIDHQITPLHLTLITLRCVEVINVGIEVIIYMFCSVRRWCLPYLLVCCGGGGVGVVLAPRLLLAY